MWNPFRLADALREVERRELLKRRREKYPNLPPIDEDDFGHDSDKIDQHELEVLRQMQEAHGPADEERAREAERPAA